VEDRQGKLLVYLQVALIGLSIAGARAAQDAARASGTLTINGTAVPLRHASATPQPAFFDKNSEDIRIRLSDVPLPSDDDFELIRLARQGALRVVEVTVDAKGEPMTGAIYAKEFNGMVSLAGMHKFTPERIERTAIAGRLWIESIRTFMNVTFVYDATFSAAIPRPPTEEERRAALASPAARAVEAYLTALRSGELSAFVGTLSKAAAADYAGAAGEARFKRLRAEMPADTKPANVTKLPDGRVQISVEGHQNGTVIEYLLTVVIEAGTWKIDK
jgi:hypothetical protein